MKPSKIPTQRPAFFHVIVAMLRLAIQVHPVMTLVYVLTSLAFTGLLIANLHLISVLLNRLPLFANGQISYTSVLQAILLLGAGRSCRSFPK